MHKWTEAREEVFNIEMFLLNLENPKTGKPLIETILVNPNQAGTAQIVYFNAGGNGDYIRKIKKHPSAWW